MNLSEIQAVALSVLGDFRVILAALFVIFYLQFIYFVVGYKKKPPVVKLKKKPIVVEAPAEEQSEDADSENDDSDDVLV